MSKKKKKLSYYEAHKNKAPRKLKYFSINKKHRRLVSICYNAHANVNNVVVVNKRMWNENKPNRLKQIREGQTKRKQMLASIGEDYHTKEQRKKFALAKCKKSNNKLGYYIISNYDINYTLIERKIKKTYNKVYKNNNNLMNQLEAIREIILIETNKDIDLVLMIDLTNESLRNRGLL